MYVQPPTMLQLLALIARKLGSTSKRIARAILPGVLALILMTAAFAAFTYEAAYTDASGAKCLAFRVTPTREADLCSGAFDRKGPMPPAWPIDWTTRSKQASGRNPGSIASLKTAISENTRKGMIPP